MPYEFKIERRVEFADTDLAGILHFANYFRYMEAAEHAFLRSLGVSVHTGKDVFGWVRTNAECSYHAPVRFDDVVELHLLVREKRSKSLTYEIVFRADDTEIARGSFTVVCVTKAPDGRLRAMDMPREIDEQVQVAPK